MIVITLITFVAMACLGYAGGVIIGSLNMPVTHTAMLLRRFSVHAALGLGTAFGLLQLVPVLPSALIWPLLPLGTPSVVVDVGYGIIVGVAMMYGGMHGERSARVVHNALVLRLELKPYDHTDPERQFRTRSQHA